MCAANGLPGRSFHTLVRQHQPDSSSAAGGGQILRYRGTVSAGWRRLFQSDRVDQPGMTGYAASPGSGKESPSGDTLKSGFDGSEPPP